MRVLQVASVLLAVLVVGAEKKIELQDIEDDNLKSEKQKNSNGHPEARSQTDGTGLLPAEFFKNSFLRYFEAPPPPESDQRYVQQYSVSEAPERAPATPKPQYGPPPISQHAMVGYLSNVPMQIYLVPQYYSEPAQPAAQHGGQYQPTNIARVSGYQSTPEPQHSHNYVEVPTYVAPPGKSYLPQYTQPVTYVYPQQTITPVQATVAPILTYQMPVVQYPTAILTQHPSKEYYQNSQYTQPSAVEEPDNDIDDKQYSSQTEAPYVKPDQEFPRHYNSRTPYRDEYRSGPSELPHPSPLLLKPAPPHLSHLPKALPMYRPVSKPVYASANIIQAPLTPKPIEAYGPKRRPTSLLDSYIPSSVQVEYLKRGLAKDPLVLYETLSNGRHFPPAPIIPRHYERGFLPNQMYHTAAGGITFGHHKRSSKGDKVPGK